MESVAFCMHCGTPIDEDAVDALGSAVCIADDGFIGVHDFDLDFELEN